MTSASCILCPQDFSPCSEAALARACELARALGQSIELMHVYQLNYYFPDPVIGMDAAMTLEGLETIRKRAEEMLEEQRRRVEALGLRASVRLEEGNPASLIAQRSSAPEISMVVMGTHGRKALGRLLLGSVAEHVVRAAHAPVMTVRLAD